MTMPRTDKSRWLVPTGLILLVVVPVAAGAFRIVQLASGGPVTPGNARFFASPLPVVAHIVGASVFCVFGALQFVPALRRRPWHRRAGRIVLPCGVLAAATGLWMTVFYPLPDTDGTLLNAQRLVFGTAMMACLATGFVAIRRGDVARHRAYVMRGYAIGMGAGTQVFTNLPWLLATGHQPGQFPRALLMGAGWVVNLAIAEWLIRRSPGRRPGRRPIRAAQPAAS